MRNIKELFDRLEAQKDFHKRYPNYDPEDDKVHILFVSPCMNANGILSGYSSYVGNE